MRAVEDTLAAVDTNLEVAVDTLEVVVTKVAEAVATKVVEVRVYSPHPTTLMN